MKKCIIASIVAATLCIWTNSFAEVQTSKAYDQCLERAGGSTIGMRQCTSEEINRLDAELNSLYKKIMRKLDQKIKEQSADPSSLYGKELAQAKKDLLAAQRAWIKYRDADVSFTLNISSCGGGTMGRLMAGSRNMEILAQRVQDLKAALGELSQN